MKSERARLSRENRKEEKFVANENREMYLDMLAYIRNANISPLCQEKVRKIVIEKLQESDVEINLDELIDECPPITKQQLQVGKIIMVMTTIGIYGFYTVFMNIGKNLTESVPWSHYQLALSDIVIYAMFFAVIYFIMKKIRTGKFDISKVENKLIQTFGLWIIMIGIVMVGDVAYKFLWQFSVEINLAFAVVSYSLILVISKIWEVRVE